MSIGSSADYGTPGHALSIYNTVTKIIKYFTSYHSSKYLKKRLFAKEHCKAGNTIASKRKELAILSTSKCTSTGTHVYMESKNSKIM